MRNIKTVSKIRVWPLTLFIAIMVRGGYDAHGTSQGWVGLDHPRSISCSKNQCPKI